MPGRGRSCMPHENYIPSHERYKVDVPEGHQGSWAVERFTVSEAESKRSYTHAALRGRGAIPAGTYTRLRHGHSTIMSDTPDEIYDHLGFIRAAQGTVLIHGLGIGMCLSAVAAKPEVTHVLCVEISEDVITLVAPHYRSKFGDKVQVIQGDAFTWKPAAGRRWDFVWHDIWPDLTEDNLDEMTTLHRRFGGRATWMGSWGREILRNRRGR